MPSSEAQAALNSNNQARAAHHLPNLAWDDKLAHDAQVWANELAQLHQMKHSDGSKRPGEGENLFSGTGRDYTFNDGVKAWLGEAKDYHGEAVPQGNFEKYGHYTQCLWKSTTHVGMAKAKGSNGCWYIVGRYSPPGNFTGQKPY